MITKKAEMIRPETLEHGILWVSITCDGNPRGVKAAANKFARGYANSHGYHHAVNTTEGATCTPRETEYRYGYVLG